MSDNVAKPQTNFILSRLEEPSTWAGIGVIVTVAAPYIEEALKGGNLATAIVAILSGAIAVLKTENKS
jgi:hypothetical protein